jgi:hypothetical protein
MASKQQRPQQHHSRHSSKMLLLPLNRKVDNPSFVAYYPPIKTNHQEFNNDNFFGFKNNVGKLSVNEIHQFLKEVKNKDDNNKNDNNDNDNNSNNNFLKKEITPLESFMPSSSTSLTNSLAALEQLSSSSSPSSSFPSQNDIFDNSSSISSLPFVFFSSDRTKPVQLNALSSSVLPSPSSTLSSLPSPSSTLPSPSSALPSPSLPSIDNNIKEQKQNRSKDDNKSNQVSDKILKKEKRKKKD